MEIDAHMAVTVRAVNYNKKLKNEKWTKFSFSDSHKVSRV